MHVFCNFAKTKQYNQAIFRWSCGAYYGLAGRTVTLWCGLYFSPLYGAAILVVGISVGQMGTG